MNQKTCKTGNAALYCVEDTNNDYAGGAGGGKDSQEEPVSAEPAPASQQTADAPAPPKPDFATFDIVKATQYGAYDRVRHLVLDEGYDVNARDSENVSLLHWAAINNRQELADFLIQNGAQVDPVGGDLRSAPIHWAVRQGHLPMVVKLLAHGADPTFKDAEGCDCLHLAAQLGHTAIVAYLVAKGCPVNSPDGNGMTPLMWSCLRVTNSMDPTRLLLTMGASVSITDAGHGNSPLHWALLGKNAYAIQLLMDRPGVDFHAVNLNGETPASLFESLTATPSGGGGDCCDKPPTNASKQKPLFVNRKVAERFHQEMASVSPKRRQQMAWVASVPVLRSAQAFVKDKKFRLGAMAATPTIYYWAIGSILNAGMSYWLKLFLFVCLWLLTNVVRDFVFDERLFNVIPLAIYFAIKFWGVITWLLFIYPHVQGQAYC